MKNLNGLCMVIGLLSWQAVMADDPLLPPGLADEISVADTIEQPASDNLGEITGFWELRLGSRLQEDPLQDKATLAETRLQLAYDRFGQSIGLRVVADLVYDDLEDEHQPDLDVGEGWLDVRELNAFFSVTDNLDIKLGRQILTWGIGDLLFINDPFPKDFQSFFLGREENYLKAPSDAVKFSLYNDVANIDLVYTPQFDADRFIDGSRLSFFDNQQGQRAGGNDILQVAQPDASFSDDEVALRLYRNLKGYELAAYIYSGFWKSPAGFDTPSGRVIFPQLKVYGASVRGDVAGGITTAEIGFYDSAEDTNGRDPLIRNSELRVLFGYEWEVSRDLNMGLQYYLERMLDYDEYRKTLLAGSDKLDENRHLITFRVTHLAARQKLRLSVFAFYSPSDEDGYLKPALSYKLHDNVTIETGANAFFRNHQHSFFGQFENNSNLYVSVRYHFSTGL